MPLDELEKTAHFSNEKKRKKNLEHDFKEAHLIKCSFEWSTECIMIQKKEEPSKIVMHGRGKSGKEPKRKQREVGKSHFCASGADPRTNHFSQEMIPGDFPLDLVHVLEKGLGGLIQLVDAPI